MACPMSKEAIIQHQLTDKQVKSFCDKGCSIQCPELFKAYVTKRNRQEIEDERALD